MLIDVQFLPSGRGWAGLVEAGRAAEQRGFGTIWLFDHLQAATLNADAPMLELCTTLGALAAATTTIGLGTLVANVANRHAAVLALSVATAQQISGGRVIAGLGAGAAPGTRWAAEHESAGIPLAADPADRHRAVIAQIEALRAATTVPVIVGANSTALAELAGRHADGLNVRLDHPRAAELLDTARQAAPGPFEVSAFAIGETPEARQRAASLALDRLIVVDRVETFLAQLP